MTRNLFDCVVSIRDHVCKWQHMSQFHIPDDFADLAKEDQYDYIIKFIMPWYVEFYVSWCRAAARGIVDPLWLLFDDIVNDSTAAVRLIADKFGLDVSDEWLVAALDKEDHNRQNFNVGQSGRGAQLLSERQQEQIVGLCAYHRDVDFSPITNGNVLHRM